MIFEALRILNLLTGSFASHLAFPGLMVSTSKKSNQNNENPRHLEIETGRGKHEGRGQRHNAFPKECIYALALFAFVAL